eukprot:COSAG02_NODE_53_length_44062_cov_22.860223_19_plen_206_part_00
MEPIRTLNLATHFRQVRAKDANGEFRDDMWQRCARDDEGATAMAFKDVPPERLAEPPLTPNDFEAVIGGARSSVAPEDLIPFDKWTEQYGQDGSGASGQRGEDHVAEFETTDAATASSNVPGDETGVESTSTSEGLGQLLAQLAAQLPAAIHVSELERRVASLERQLAAAQAGGGNTSDGGAAALAEGEPHADSTSPASVDGGGL